MNDTKPSRSFTFTGGVLLGMLLAGFGAITMMQKLFPEQQVFASAKPVVRTVTKVVPRVVTKEVERIRVVEKEKIVDRKVVEPKLYRAVLIENGKVTRSWEIVKCDFKVIGAILTDKDGNTFEVTGNIEVEPIE